MRQIIWISDGRSEADDVKKPGGRYTRRAAKVMQGQADRHLDPHHVLEDTSATPPGRQNDETPVSTADRGLSVSSRRAVISPPRLRG